jgi:beta-glucanase (GH16 family)
VPFTNEYSPTNWDEAANATVSGGVLNLTETYTGGVGGVGVGGMVVSSGTFDHGYFEARVKFPEATGFDAAFWLRSPLSVTGPLRPEIDILEAFPNSEGVFPGDTGYQATLHYPSGGSLLWHQITYEGSTSLVGAWHTYAVNWLPGQSLEFFLDGVSIGKITSDVLPATPLNIALSFDQSGWPMPPDATTPTSATMQVDWVHWYDTMP